MQPPRELSLQKAVCLVLGWPRPAGGTLLGPWCLQRCWPRAGSCPLPGAVPYGQAPLRRLCPQRPACPWDVMLGSGAECCPTRSLRSLLFSLTDPARKETAASSPGQRVPYASPWEREKSLGPHSWERAVPGAAAGGCCPSGAAVWPDPGACWSSCRRESRARGRGKPLASSLRTERAEPGGQRCPSTGPGHQPCPVPATSAGSQRGQWLLPGVCGRSCPFPTGHGGGEASGSSQPGSAVTG